MISVLSYGRLVARAVLGGLAQTDSRDYSLVTASCGFGKDFRKGILKKGMCYGDDACFIARHRSADVLVKLRLVMRAGHRPRCQGEPGPSPQASSGQSPCQAYATCLTHRENHPFTLRCSPGQNRAAGSTEGLWGQPSDLASWASHALYAEVLWNGRWLCSGPSSNEPMLPCELMGVADGVGGWRDYGVDPSQFSLTLMRTCERLVREGRFTACSPVGILTTSYYELLQNKVPLMGGGGVDTFGSSTACIVVLDRRSHRLHTANLGDSGFLVVRGGEVVHRSDEQQHYFNTPFQLSIPPPEAEGAVLRDRLKSLRGGGLGAFPELANHVEGPASGVPCCIRPSSRISETAVPEAADRSSFDVQLGDIILTATDGLFDNMPDYMILQELKKLKNSNYESIQQTARSIAEQAHELAYDPNYMSPFAQFACDNGLNVRGGKPDDITVLLSIVAEYTD
ncbi:hypothetical protein JZ751_005306 [Albula glossodonta]|uniref:Protein phosphatase n=1 Tax=Albula glossodonta TaxID=121402 RepID=A0A8T2N5W8_9TELE|nr:hypothetical protein JZ751_005306 [Albula glossodonta]